MKAAYIQALIIVVMMALSITVSAESEIVAERLHTPGFPYVVGDLESLARLFKSLALISGNASIQDAAFRLENCDSLDCLYDNRIIASIIDRGLESSAGLNYGALKSSGLEELLALIEDPELRGMLEEIMKAGTINPSTLANILDKAQESKNSGKLSDAGYMALLELLKRIAGNAEDRNALQRISKEQLEEAVKLIAKNKSVIEEFMNVAQNILEKYRDKRGVPNLALEDARHRAQRSSMPTLSLTIPETPVNLLILLIIMALIAGAIYAVLNVIPMVISVRGSKGLWQLRSGDLAGTLRLYWESVKLVEGRTRVYMKDTLTHREYMEAVKSLLGPLAEPFKKITIAYERVRFGGAPEETVHDDAIKSYEELRRGETL